MADTTTPVRQPNWQHKHNPYPNTAEDSDDPAVLRAQIEQTRANMTETVNTIQARLSPETLKREAQEKVRDATIGKVEEMAYTAKRSARNWRTNLVETVRRNPVPAALVGIGLGWLLMEGSGDTDEVQHRYYPQNYQAGRGSYRAGSGYGYEEQGVMQEARDRARGMVANVQDRASEVADTLQDRTGEVVDTVQERATEMVDDIQQTVSNVTHQARDRAEHLTHQAERQATEMRDWARYEARQAKYGFQQMLQENPMAVGAAAIAIGAAIGLALPNTEMEDEWMGQTRDRLMHQAQETAQETMQKVKNVAEDAQHAAKEEVMRAAEREDLPLPAGQPMRENQ